MDDKVKNLVDRIRELRAIRAKKGDYRESFPVAYNQLLSRKKFEHPKEVHIILPSVNGSQTKVIRYMKGSSAEIVQKVEELYGIIGIDDDDPDNFDAGSYGIYSIKDALSNDKMYSSEDMQRIVEYIFKHVIAYEKNHNGNYIKVHNFKDVLLGLQAKYNIPDVLVSKHGRGRNKRNSSEFKSESSKIGR